MAETLSAIERLPQETSSLGTRMNGHWIAAFTVGVTLLPESRIGAQESTDLEQLSQLETVWNEAHTAGDAEALDRLWAEDLVVTVPGMAVMTKADALGIMRSGRMRFDRYETTGVEIRVQDDVGIVTGELSRSRMLGDPSTEDHWRFTKVYVKREGRWVVIAFHASTR